MHRYSLTVKIAENGVILRKEYSNEKGILLSMQDYLKKTGFFSGKDGFIIPSEYLEISIEDHLCENKVKIF